MAKDIEGKLVNLGDKVKVLHIGEDVWKYLPEEEQNDIKSMIGEVFEVYEVTEFHASVEKWWNDGNNKSHSHSIALKPEEMKLVI